MLSLSAALHATNISVSAVDLSNVPDYLSVEQMDGVTKSIKMFPLTPDSVVLATAVRSKGFFNFVQLFDYFIFDQSSLKLLRQIHAPTEDLQLLRFFPAYRPEVASSLIRADQPAEDGDDWGHLYRSEASCQQ